LIRVVLLRVCFDFAPRCVALIRVALLAFGADAARVFFPGMQFRSEIPLPVGII
jgi:hypothetical protein